MNNNWKEIIRKDLFERQDTGYGDFQSKLMPTVPRERIIGIRTPVLKKYVKDLLKNDTIEIDDFCMICHIIIMRKIIFICL